MFTMKELPFGLDALEPYMSAETVDFHYNKHYRTYVDKLNELTKDTPYADMSLEGVMKESFKHPKDKAVFNNAAQAWNHQFFWNSLSDKGGALPQADVMKLVERSFGSFEAFKKEFKAKALGQFGSGWCWVVKKDDKISITATSNADNPIVLETGEPLICLDVWEHAYYLDYQNRRADFTDAFLNYLIKW